MNENDGGILDWIRFPRNKDGWILVSQVLGNKIIATSTFKPKEIREGNRRNQHREFYIQLDTSIKIKPKLEIDISKFIQK